MTLAYPRALGPGVRRVVGDDELVEIGVDDGVALLRPGASRSIVVLHQRPPDPSAVLAEADRLGWLDGRAGAPDVLAAGRADEGDEAVVVRLAPDASTVAGGHPLGPEHLARELARLLRELHSVDVAPCPLDAGFAQLRAEVAERLVRGEIAVAAEGPYAGREPEDLVELLDARFADIGEGRPAVVHGGLSAARIWFDTEGTTTLTGWRRGGVGDAHLDLAGAARVLGELYGPAAVPVFFEAYDLDRVDPHRLDAHQLLDHLLRPSP